MYCILSCIFIQFVSVSTLHLFDKSYLCFSKILLSVLLCVHLTCSLLTQQCCYDNSGMLLADPGEARPSIGTPLYQSFSTMVTYYRETVLPFVYCCKEGLPGKKRMAQCDDFQSMLPTNNGNGYSPPVPGMGLPCLYYINLL